MVMLSYLFSGTIVVKWHIQLFTWKGSYEHEEKYASHMNTNNVNGVSDAIILYQFAVRHFSRNAINVWYIPDHVTFWCIWPSSLSVSHPTAFILDLLYELIS